MDKFSDPTPIATADAFRVALLSVRDQFTPARPFNESDGLRLLREHYAAPKHTSTSGKLADGVGFSSYSETNLRYGTFAGRIAAALGYRPFPDSDTSGTPHWWRTLAYGNDGVPLTDDGCYEWVMRPELCEALERLGWVRAPRE